MQITDLPIHPDTYQYIEGFPKGTDVGIVAETNEGVLIGAAWVRLLPTDAHTINKLLPELTMGVIPEYQHIGVGKRLMEELYKTVQSYGISKISLGVHKDNIPAVNLYKQQNWIEDGYYNEYIMMSKEIGKPVKLVIATRTTRNNTLIFNNINTQKKDMSFNFKR